jgi:hypothetical protein
MGGGKGWVPGWVGSLDSIWSAVDPVLLAVRRRCAVSPARSVAGRQPSTERVELGRPQACVLVERCAISRRAPRARRSASSSSRMSRRARSRSRGSFARSAVGEVVCGGGQRALDEITRHASPWCSRISHAAGRRCRRLEGGAGRLSDDRADHARGRCRGTGDVARDARSPSADRKPCDAVTLRQAIEPALDAARPRE